MLSQTCTYVVQPSITVTAPNGGENIPTGFTKNITWTTVGTPAITYVKIDLYKAGVFLQNIAAAATNNGTYSWQIPMSFHTGSDFKIRISNYSNVAVYDESNTAFTLTQTIPVTVISPNGGETWQAGSTQKITWTTSGVPSSNLMTIKLASNSQTITLSTTIANSAGQFSYVIPSTIVGGQYKVEVGTTIAGSGSSRLFSDQSDNWFTINSSVIAPTITVTSPVAGASLVQGQTYNIAWQAPTSIANVSINFNCMGRVGGVTIATIVQLTKNTGSYNWPVMKTSPAITGNLTDCKIIVSSPYPYYAGASGIFTIVPPGTSVTALSTQSSLASISDAIAKIFQEIQKMLNK